MQMKTLRVGWMMAALLFLPLGGGVGFADSIDPGDTVDDTLEFDEPVHRYTFDGDKDDYVTILVLDVDDDDDFYPSIRLEGPYGLFALNTDSRAAMICCFGLPADGEYTIAVTGSGRPGGNYDYVLSFVSSGDENDGGAISYGQTIQAAISPDGDLDGYRFHGHHGDRVRIRVADLQGLSHFHPHVDLVGPDGRVEGDSGDNDAEIDEELDDSGDYTIIIWGGDPDWEGGAYELTLTGPGVIPTPTPTPIPTPTPVPLPDLRVAEADIGPAAPTRLKPGDSVAVSAFIDNLGQPAGPFWVEFWGSRTGGLTLDEFICDSQYVPGLGLLGSYPFEALRPLYTLPDGPYSVVTVVDRPGMVGEWDEGNNRFVIPGKRLLVLRPPANVDLVVQGANVSPKPPQAGQVATFSGTVRNVGAQNSGFFWIEFWRSPDAVYPLLGNMVCDSIPIGDLAPGGAINLGAYPRAIYTGVPLKGRIGIFVDRPDTVNETDETNNYEFTPSAGPPPGDMDLWVSSAADFTPAAPVELQPGSMLSFTVNLINSGPHDTGSFWLEFWGSRTGGVTLDTLLCDSLLVPNLGAVQPVHYSVSRPLYAIPDGPYSVVVVADRLGQVAGDWPGNNRRAIASKRLLMIRPPSQANLKVEGFAFGGSSVLTRGGAVTLAGAVRNVGSQATGPFWIEFWASCNQQYPTLDWFVCDSIWLSGLEPGASVNLSLYPRTLYNTIPPGFYAIGCFVDRDDMVSETDETDNYTFLTGYQVF